jgi:hypothetical protein
LKESESAGQDAIHEVIEQVRVLLQHGGRIGHGVAFVTYCRMSSSMGRSGGELKEGVKYEVE